MAEKMKEASGGRLEIQVMTPAELGFKGTEILSSLRDNILEIAEVPYSFSTGELPWLGIADIPFSFREPYLEHAKVTKAIRPDIEKLAADYDHTIYYLGREHMLPYLVLYTKKPIKSIEDMKGLKIRIYNVYQEGFLKEAGVAPVFMPYAEVPMALAQGIIDGVLTSGGLASQLKVKEAGVTYETGLYPGYILTSVGVSNKAFKALPADLQQTVLDVMKWFDAENTAHCYNPVFGDALLQSDRDLGMTITPPQPAMVDILEGYAKKTSWVSFAKDAGAKGTDLLDKMLAIQGRSR
jgi:TRAP-type C4-dicarboxylate transport system substrate-binding protein